MSILLKQNLLMLAVLLATFVVGVFGGLIARWIILGMWWLVKKCIKTVDIILNGENNES